MLGMLLNAGGGGGEVAGSLRAMVASGADLQDQASVSATFGPTSRVITVGVQRIRGSAQGQGRTWPRPAEKALKTEKGYIKNYPPRTSPAQDREGY